MLRWLFDSETSLKHLANVLHKWWFGLCVIRIHGLLWCSMMFSFVFRGTAGAAFV